MTDTAKFYRHLIRIFFVWILLGIVVAGFTLAGVEMSKITRDPTRLAHVPYYYGFLSNLGILVWAAGAFIPFFSSFHVHVMKVKGLLRGAGILTLILLLDDFFLFHETIAPKVLHIPESVVYLSYLVAFAVFFFRHLHVILKRTEYWILVLGTFLGGVAVLIDAKFLPGGKTNIDDILKLLGMVAYSYYWIMTSSQALSQNPRNSSANRAESE